jgi:DNA-binding transcriptional MerR regulator
MTARSYLSIGDVLTLLRQEFPDITISKIRFLESQGLVDPERTPSGYRKFYQHDVDRLRWILQQQRENFLPLKVIKDRLEDDTSTTEPSSATVGSAPERVEPVMVSPHVSPHVTTTSDGSLAASLRMREEVALPGIDAPASGSTSTAAVERNHETRVGALAGRRPREGPTSVMTTAPTGAGAHAAGLGKEPAASSLPASARAAPAPVATAGKQGSEPADSSDAASSGARSRSRPSRATASGSGSSGGSGGRGPRGGGRRRGSGGSGGLSADDLATSSGLPVEVVEELASYGLLAPTVVAGFATFDEVDLAITKLAAQLAPFGIEPRHLRLYKNAADREAGFVEQVVLPLLRQRNPDARSRAEVTAEELVSLGQELRSSLLQRALGGLLQR